MMLVQGQRRVNLETSSEEARPVLGSARDSGDLAQREQFSSTPLIPVLSSVTTIATTGEFY